MNVDDGARLAEKLSWLHAVGYLWCFVGIPIVYGVTRRGRWCKAILCMTLAASAAVCAGVFYVYLRHADSVSMNYRHAGVPWGLSAFMSFLLLKRRGGAS
jgi:hypothetical protein